ncbi:hypothetical protein GCM10010372_32080 [Streptomyces tauricus]|nr:hypothetical protein GCM10010372_32080 [Streptomyces tauricus]
MHHDPSTSAMRPNSQLPACSRTCAESGRNTPRSPWHIHFSGNTALMPSIQSGMVSMEMYTPEMNCSTRKGSTTTEVALLPVLGTELIAMPSRAHAVRPSRKIQPKCSHLVASEGSSTP